MKNSIRLSVAVVLLGMISFLTSCSSDSPNPTPTPKAIDAPLIEITPATAQSESIAVIKNYNATYTYNFTPVGASVSSNGTIINTNVNTSYVVNASFNKINSTDSSFYINDKKVVPTIANPKAIIESLIMTQKQVLLGYSNNLPQYSIDNYFTLNISLLQGDSIIEFYLNDSAYINLDEINKPQALIKITNSSLPLEKKQPYKVRLNTKLGGWVEFNGIW